MSVVPYTARPTRQVSPTILLTAVADGRDAVQRALHPGAVVRVECTDALDHVVDLLMRDLSLAEHLFTVHITGGRQPPQVQDHFQQLVRLVELTQPAGKGRRQHIQHRI